MRPVLVGLVNLSARILSLPLSLTFLYLVSSVPQEDYARWTFLSAGILGLMSIPLGSVSGLISRYSAEGKPVGYAVILETVLLSLELPLLWLLDLSLELRLLSSIYLVVFSIYALVNNVAIGKRPARSGLSQLIFNVGKVGLGILLIKFFYLDGIFMTYILAYLLQCVYLLRYVKLNLALTGNPASLIVKSLMLSVRNVRVFFEGLSNVIMESLHANAEALYGMAQQLSIPSTWPSSLNVATFSAVKEGTHHVNPILRSYLTIGSTITSLSVVFGFAFLSLFRQDYLIAVYPLLILSVANYVRGIYGILFNAMLGTDPSLSYESGSLNSITVRVELFYLVLSTSSLSIPFLLPRSLSTPTILIIVPLTFLVSSVIMSILLTRIVGRELSISIGPRELLINVVVLLIGSCILLPLPSIVAVPLATTLILLVQLGLNGHMRTIVKKRIDFIVFVLQQGNQQVKSLHSLHES